MADERLTFILESRDLSSGVTRKVRNEMSGLGGVMGKLRSQFALGTIAGNLATRGIYALGSAITESIGEASEFQTKMLNVNSITKASAGEFANMSQQVLDLSKTLPQSASTLAGGLYDIASSGFKGADGMEVLEAAARAASAGLTTTDVSASGLTAVLNAYGLSADQASHISDIMFQTVNLGVLTFEELSSEIGKTTALSAPLGVSFEEVSAALSLMTRHGIDAANATTQINSIMNNLLKPSKQAADLAIELGLGWDAESLKARGLSGVLADLVEKTGGNHQQMATLLGDQRAIRGAFVLAADGGAAFNAEVEAMGNAAGATSSALSEQEKGLSFQLSLLANNFQALITENIAPMMADLAQVARTQVLPALKTILPIFQTLAEHIIPLLAVVIGSKLISAFRAAAAEGKLAALATKGAWLGMAVVVQQAADDIKANITSQVVPEALHRWGITADEFAEVMIRAGGDAAVALDIIRAAGTDTSLALRLIDAAGGSTKDALKAIQAAGGDAGLALMILSGGVRENVGAFVLGAKRYRAAVAPFGTDLPNALNRSRTKANAIVKATIDELVSSLVSGQTDWQDAWHNYGQIMENDLTEAQEVARLRGFLTGKELNVGLHSTDPERRAAAEQMRETIKERLWALQHDVPEIARRTGQSYADALKGEKQKSHDAALAHKEAVESGLRFNAYWLGRQGAESWADGLRDAGPAVGKAANILREIAMGPLSFSGSPPFTHSRWLGEMVGKTYGEGLNDEIGAIKMPMLPNLNGSMAPMTSYAGAGGIGNGGGRSLTLNINLPPTTVPYSPSQLDDAARTLVPPVLRELQRQGF